MLFDGCKIVRVSKDPSAYLLGKLRCLCQFLGEEQFDEQSSIIHPNEVLFNIRVIVLFYTLLIGAKY
jgi:hypothetical protein